MTNIVPSLQHHTVMGREVLSMLVRDHPGVYVDCTLGGGGHARALLDASPAPAMVIGLDRDPACITAAHQWGAAWHDRFRAMHGNFRYLSTLLETLGYPRVDGIVFDFGVSSYQLDTARRGFSFRRDGPLDMRMDPAQKHTASAFVNQASEVQLRDALRDFGEERWANRIAKALVSERQQEPIIRTRQLAELVAHAIPRKAWPRDIHPATRAFQALRIAVNDELGAIQEALPQALTALRPGGRMVAIAFHSLEDRQAKQFFAREAKGCVCPPRIPQCVCGQVPRLKLLNRKPLLPLPQDIQENPRSRSARLRAAEKLALGG